jgi:hypothetical protein
LVLLVLLFFSGYNKAVNLMENGEVALLEHIGDSPLLHHRDVHAGGNGTGQRDRLARSVIIQEEKDISPWSYPASYKSAKKNPTTCSSWSRAAIKSSSSIRRMASS